MFPGMTAFPCPHFVAASASSTLAILSAAVSVALCLKKPDTTRTEFPMRISVTQSAGAVLFMLCLICSFFIGHRQTPFNRSSAFSAVPFSPVPFPCGNSRRSSRQGYTSLLPGHKSACGLCPGDCSARQGLDWS